MPISLSSLCRMPRSKAVNATTMPRNDSQNQTGVPSQSIIKNSMKYSLLDTNADTVWAEPSPSQRSASSYKLDFVTAPYPPERRVRSSAVGL